MGELARTLTGYAYILRNERGQEIGLACAPPDIAAHLTEEEKRRLPLVTQAGVIPAVAEGETTDFFPKCWCNAAIDKNNCVILVEQGQYTYFCCGEHYR